MELLTLSWFGFVLTGLGTLFLIGELIVNMRGFFGILGIGFIVTYFSVHLEPTTLALMLILYFIGLILIIVDGKLINDGTLAIIGLVLMIGSVAITSEDIYSGMYAVLGVIFGSAGSFAFLKIFKPRNMWGRIALQDRLTAEEGYSTMNTSYQELIDKEGITMNVLRPVGTVKINDQEYSAISNGQWIEKDTVVKVIEVDGTRILVDPVED
ncbi:MAG TPA: NfeD family protein [Bacillota bacterium]|nr:NfeD family protein [Bacillota bacterium]